MLNSPSKENSTLLNILWTVDVEDYYMSPESIPVSTWDRGLYEDRISIGCTKLLDLFSANSIQATWFFLGWIAEKHPELVKAAHQQGHEIATHTYDHRPVYTLDPEEYKDSLKRSCDILQSITGEKVIGHRAPEWSLKRDMVWAIRILIDLGFMYDSSINPISTYLYGDKGAPQFPYLLNSEPPLWEIPPASIQIARLTVSVGGGFFLRAFPVLYMKNAIRRYNRRGLPAIVYVHPWELDPEHRVPELPFKEKLIHFWGLKTTERKMRTLTSLSTSQTVRKWVDALY